MPTRSSYWSNSKFADWLRGSAKGGAKTSQEWHSWHKESRQAHPIRYWIAEEALDRIQDTLMWPLDKLYDLKYYVNNRWVTRTHCLTAHPRDIPRGEWRDVGNRFLPCLFNELVNFVEIELAWKNVAYDEKARVRYQVPWYGMGVFRWRTWRCPEAGIEHLNWEINLVKDRSWGLSPDDAEYGEPTDQARTALEILSLYTWWTQVYTKRQDPHDESGWTEACAVGRKDSDDFLSMLDNTDPEYTAMRDRAHERLREIETQREQEDTDMLIRLIKVRERLWT